MARETSPTTRALLTLELIQRTPGVTAYRLSRCLGVSERAVRRSVDILREADIPIESTRGRYGGYRIGRGMRLPPLMFTTAEALGLVMAVLEGHGATEGTDPVATALAKMTRVLPAPVAAAADAVRTVSARSWDGAGGARPHPETVATLVQACAAQVGIRIDYRLGDGREREMDVDPWAVVVRHGRWYLLCWSRTVDARRVLRVDRVTAVARTGSAFVPPEGIDPVAVVDEHLSQSWTHPVDVVVEAPPDMVARWLLPSRARLEELEPSRTRLIATTDNPDWYAGLLAAIEAPFHVVGSPEMRAAVSALGRRLLDAASATPLR